MPEVLQVVLAWSSYHMFRMLRGSQNIQMLIQAIVFLSCAPGHVVPMCWDEEYRLVEWNPHFTHGGWNQAHESIHWSYCRVSFVKLKVVTYHFLRDPSAMVCNVGKLFLDRRRDSAIQMNASLFPHVRNGGWLVPPYGYDYLVSQTSQYSWLVQSTGPM